MAEPKIPTAESLSLAADFPPARHDAWLKLVEKTLQGADFDKKLVSRTYDGIAIAPLYTRADWNAEGDPSGLPGGSPFTRGGSVLGTLGGWDVRQSHGHPDPAAANAQILEDLERGATSIVLKADPTGANGVAIQSLKDFDGALKDVLLDLAPVVLEPHGPSLPLAAIFIALIEKRGVARDALAVNFGADPLGTLARSGKLIVSIDTALARMADLGAYVAKSYPKARAVNVRSLPYHDAGASEAQELGCALATGVEYLRALTGAGLDVDAACAQMSFTLTADADFFQTIAKFRAFRKLWARVTEACGASLEHRSAHVTGAAAPRMLTRRDPWVNMLRCTAACFAAGVGGADAVTVAPFDAALGLPSDLGRRIARNTQTILQEESGLGNVIDPAGGAWLFESLTDRLAEAAWTFFRGIEKSGGMTAALIAGDIATRIDEVWQKRAENIAKRRDPITGVSEFPHIIEAPVKAATAPKAPAKAAPTGTVPSLPAAGNGALTAGLVKAVSGGANIAALTAALTGEGFSITPLPGHRLAEDFESLRDAADAWRQNYGQWPKIYLANVGAMADFSARSMFAKNFFEAGGIEAVAGSGGADPSAIAKDFKGSGAGLAVICSTDALYAQSAAVVAQALKAAGAGAVYLAGRGGAQEQILRAAGVDAFIYMGCNVRAVLEDAHRRLGITGK